MTDCLNHSQNDDSWTLIEEGLGGRTTMYHPESGETYRLGDAYLHPCLLSHRPLDYVVLMLGTNDLQPKMHKTPFTREHLADGLIHLIKLIRSLPECGAGNQPAKILVVAPPPIKMAKGRPEVSEKYGCEAGVILSMSLHLPIKMPPKRTTAVILMPVCTQKPGMPMESISLWKAIRGLEKLSLRQFLLWMQITMEIRMRNIP